MITTIQLLACLGIAGVLVTSGVLKLRDREGATAAVGEFAVIPDRLAGPIGRLLPYAEIGIGVLLVVTWQAGYRAAGVLATVLLLGFTLVVGISLARGEAPSCHCFGEATAEPISRWTLVRNIALVVIALLTLSRSFPGVPRTIADQTGAERILLITTVAAAAAASWSLLHAASLHRDLATAREAASRAGIPAGTFVASPIPQSSVLRADGEPVSLAELSRERAQLLIGVAPACGNCKELAPAFAGWREALRAEVGVTIVSWGGLPEALDHYGDQSEFLYADPAGFALTSLGISGTPGAVLLGTNGKVAAGPALGGEAIMELITAIVQAIGVNVMTGTAHQTRQARPLGGEDQGTEHLPAAGSLLAPFEVVDESGRRQAFRDAIREVSEDGIPVVAWRDSCPYCGEIAAELRQFSERGEVVLLINEPIASVRAQGLTGPVLQTVDIDASAALGVPGTPAGMPVLDGVVQPGGGVGGGSVLRMLVERAEAAGSYVETPALAEARRLQAHQQGEHADASA
ncbi:hypothetical protein G9U51_12580 [Calidifontibacter sp. DB0510]|uniref:Thioredoxin domain-containing protein n=1 Tax=Metallococcus carri TaxID=1656884 RepID=A0A967B0N1_9MICO|nr:MauE/DoxX family redox-associated membrane protein [Metallococcus carri]NHN56616.1 hypothetical protein [Metallococcus carri]NOP38915.1 hypothetical protein [Calidifontibacter sp. DB2511S]